LEEFRNQRINHNAVDQKATSASLGGRGYGPFAPPGSTPGQRPDCFLSFNQWASK